MKKLIYTLAFLGLFQLSNAQVKAPQPSPAAQLKQTVGLTEITVDYSRPSAKERKVFGDLVPYNQVWRTGANGSTDISFDTDVVFGGTAVKAGKYALYTVPGEKDWDVILYTDSELWGSPEKLEESLIAVRFKVQSEKTGQFVESLNISFDDLRNNSAHLQIAWENTIIEIPITVDSKKDVLASIDKTLSGPSANDYHQAASYYLSENMDLDKALSWSEKAVQMRPEAFWMIKLQSEIYAAKGDFANAIATAKKSQDLAQKAGNDGYVKMNAANIEKWSK